MDEYMLKDILELIRRPVSSELLSHVADQVAMVISCHKANASVPSIVDNKFGVLPSLPSFVSFLVKRSSVRTGTLLGSLVFLKRLQQTLSKIAKGMPCTSHRIFLATLIVTSKALHDTSPKNKHWAKYAAYFTLSEINLMEKQLLSLMNYRIIITPTDFSNAYYEFKLSTSPLLPIIPQHLVLKPLPAVLTSTTDVDIPTYAALYSSTLPVLTMNGSNTSLSSSDSDNSVSTVEDEKYLEETLPPTKAHCRSRNAGTFLSHEESGFLQ